MHWITTHYCIPRGMETSPLTLCAYLTLFLWFWPWQHCARNFNLMLNTIFLAFIIVSLDACGRLFLPRCHLLLPNSAPVEMSTAVFCDDLRWQIVVLVWKKLFDLFKMAVFLTWTGQDERLIVVWTWMHLPWFTETNYRFITKCQESVSYNT